MWKKHQKSLCVMISCFCVIRLRAKLCTLSDARDAKKHKLFYCQKSVKKFKVGSPCSLNYLLTRKANSSLNVMRCDLIPSEKRKLKGLNV